MKHVGLWNAILNMYWMEIEVINYAKEDHKEREDGREKKRERHIYREGAREI